MFNSKFTKKDSVAEEIEKIISERWDDDDEDDDVKRADAELRRMKAKPIEADKKTDPDKEIGKLAKKTPKEVDEEVVVEGSGPKEKQHTPYSSLEQKHKEGKEYSKQIRAKYEQEKKAKAAAKIGMKKEETVAEDKWTDIADGPWKKSNRSKSSAASAAANAAGKGLKGAQHKLDVAKPKGKLTAADFKKLRKEDAEQMDEKAVTWTGGFKPDKKHMFSVHIDGDHEGTYHSLDQAKNVVANRKKSTPWRKYDIKQHKRTGTYTHEEVEISEKTLTPAESKKKEEIVKSMKKDKKGLKARYGKRWKEVAYATATKSAKRVAEEVEQVTESYGDMSHAAKELVLHADNHPHLYHSSHTPIMNNLRKKMKKGEYHPEKAKKLWAYHADRAAQSYAKEHGDGKPWHKMFSTADRKAAASHWEDMHRHELNESKGPTSNYGLETFATNEEPVTPLSRAKDLARSAMAKIKNEMLGKAGATSEEIDPRIKTTDTLKGRIKGGKDDDVGPAATGRSTKVKFTPGPK